MADWAREWPKDARKGVATAALFFWRVDAQGATVEVCNPDGALIDPDYSNYAVSGIQLP